MRLGIIGLLLAGCSEYVVHEKPPPPTADPPGSEEDDHAEPPDWTDCAGGYTGWYYNLPADHPDLESDGLFESWETVDWFDEDYLSYSQYEASLDQGSGWWPVDDGLAEDPAWFSGVWRAWIRVWDDGPVDFVAGASTDLWVVAGTETVLTVHGEDFAPEVYTVELEAGQLPLTVYYAHRAGTSGLRFRVSGDAATICVGSDN